MGALIVNNTQMADYRDYIELIGKAQLGDRESFDELAEMVQGRLYAYIFRILLRDDLAQEIVQESLIEMFNIIEKLRKTEHFWPWLRGIAFNKIRRYRTTEYKNRTLSLSDFKDMHLHWSSKKDRAILDNLSKRELKDLIFDSMQQLKPVYRMVLTMRCYEEMAYSEIAQIMGRTELNVRVIFHRAKKSLKKQLARHGFGRELLLSALILFGELTAPSEAAAAKISVTSAAIKVGPLATVMAGMKSEGVIIALKTSAALMVATGGLAVGNKVPTSWVDKAATFFKKETVQKLYITKPKNQISTAGEETWYYYPAKLDGPVILRITEWDKAGGRSYCKLLQNDVANYQLDRSKNTVYINNYRAWKNDLSSQKLAGDSLKIAELSVTDKSGGLLIITKKGDSLPQIINHSNALEEEYFQYNWPAGIKMVDNRDQMHKQGWAYFSIDGDINEEKVTGTGRIPFVYSASKTHSAWLKIRVGDRLEITDNGKKAFVFTNNGIAKKYEGGSFFSGLLKPWMGLHVIDTIRNDAARYGILCKTITLSDDGKAELVLIDKDRKLTYIIDMKRDIIEGVVFSKGQDQIGKLTFTYQTESDLSNIFVEPKVEDNQMPTHKGLSMFRLMQIAVKSN